MKYLFIMIANLGLLSSALAGSAHADSTGIMTCGFSAPIAQLNFDISSGVISYIDEDFYSPGTSEQQFLPERARLVGADLDQFVLDSEYQVINASGEEVLSLTLNFEGFDGSSAFLLYPFEAVFYMPSGSALKGGCAIPSHPLYEIVEFGND